MEVGPLGIHKLEPREGETLETAKARAIVNQLEYYFSEKNLNKDAYLVSKMNNELWVELQLVANFPMLKALSENLDEIIQAVRQHSSFLELSVDCKHIRPKKFIHRTIVVIRNVPTGTKVHVFRKWLEELKCGALTSIREDIGNNWFATFKTEEAALKCYELVRAVPFEGQQLSASMKSENYIKDPHHPEHSILTPPKAGTRPTAHSVSASGAAQSPLLPNTNGGPSSASSGPANNGNNAGLMPFPTNVNPNTANANVAGRHRHLSYPLPTQPHTMVAPLPQNGLILPPQGPPYDAAGFPYLMNDGYFGGPNTGVYATPEEYLLSNAQFPPLPSHPHHYSASSKKPHVAKLAFEGDVIQYTPEEIFQIVDGVRMSRPPELSLLVDNDIPGSAIVLNNPQVSLERKKAQDSFPKELNKDDSATKGDIAFKLSVDSPTPVRARS